jgi:MoaA/NifB/PqqE/SkfB family radical SAM enzyme
MHPDLSFFLRKARDLKMNTGLTTNGFLLDANSIDKLIAGGISRLQLSIDCIEPNKTTKKAYNLLSSQLQIIRKMDIWVHVNTVLTGETLPEAYELAKRLFSLGIPVAFSPAHDHGRLIIGPEKKDIIAFFNWLSIQKKNGMPVNMPQFLINYFKDTMSGKEVNWTCKGGSKAFYVDHEGYFRICSHTESCQKLLDVTAETLQLNCQQKKGCERYCGVSCMIISSFPFTHPGYVFRSGIAAYLSKGEKLSLKPEFAT